jgi:ketosteroid isomerase-like protein
MEITGRSAVSKKYANTQQFIDEVLRYFGTRFSSGDPFRPVHLRAIYDDEDNSTVIVVWDGQGTTTEGITYQNTYAWFMTLSGGKVVTVPLAPRTAGVGPAVVPPVAAEDDVGEPGPGSMWQPGR